MTRKRVLFCSEASFTNSGLALNARELLLRFYKSEKYELAEFAAYGGTEFYNNETRYHNLPWKYYPNFPVNHQEASQYVHEKDKWGKWKFDAVVSDFRPDICISCSDIWMCDYQAHSSFRSTYKWIIKPPIDSEVSNPEYTKVYENADAMFASSRWMEKILAKNPRINLVGVGLEGFNSVFQPVPDKSSHKVNCGFKPDDIIFGSVMRNQGRKLYPNIARTFARLCDHLEPEVWRRCKLYWHCAYPDIAWNIPRLIIENNISRKVYLTYHCACGVVFPSLYAGTQQFCPNCSEKAVMPNSHVGVSDENLAQIVNLFDCCVQYSTNEGFGRQVIECGACDVPAIVNDHSATKDFIELGAKGVPNLSTYTDPYSHREMSVPNDDILLKHMIDFAKSPRSDTWFGRKIRETYNWDVIAARWMKVIDEI